MDDRLRPLLESERRDHGIHLPGEQPLAEEAAEAVTRDQTGEFPIFLHEGLIGK